MVFLYIFMKISMILIPSTEAVTMDENILYYHQKQQIKLREIRQKKRQREKNGNAIKREEKSIKREETNATRPREKKIQIALKREENTT